MFEQSAIFFWDDDDDLQCQCCKLYPQAYMQPLKFHMCTDDVKTALYRAYCTLYSSLWCSYSKAEMKRFQVAYNDALRILHELPRWTRASHMFFD